MESNKYNYTLNSEQTNTVNKLKEKYTIKSEKSEKQLKYEEIIIYEKRTKRIPFRVAMIFCIIGLLLFGFSLVCVTTWTKLFSVGVFVGIIGIIMMLLTHKLYLKLSKSLENKNSYKILQLIKEYEKL